jgi:hypothetical protein
MGDGGVGFLLFFKALALLSLSSSFCSLLTSHGGERSHFSWNFIVIRRGLHAEKGERQKNGEPNFVLLMMIFYPLPSFFLPSFFSPFFFSPFFFSFFLPSSLVNIIIIKLTPSAIIHSSLRSPFLR